MECRICGALTGLRQSGSKTLSEGWVCADTNVCDRNRALRWPKINSDLKCSTCGGPGDYGGTIARCTNCWEVESRLADYLKSEKGREFVNAARREAFRSLRFTQHNNCNKCGGCGSVSVPGELHDVTCPQCGGHSSDDHDHEASR